MHCRCDTLYTKYNLIGKHCLTQQHILTGLKIDHERFLLVGKNLSSESEKTVKNKIDISTLVRTQEDFHFVYIH